MPLVNARNWTFAGLTLALSGCAVSLQGLVSEEGPGASLMTAEGTVYRLVTLGEAAPVARLDGHLVTIDGRRAFRTITVEDWKVPEGLHGMQVWVGPLRWHGAQLGVQDRNSGVFYTLDPGAIEALEDHVEKVVLVEGYVVGRNAVEVEYFRVLQ